MSKRFAKKHKLPPFVALPWVLLNSKAYKDLSPSAAKALPYFLGKIKRSFNDPERYTSNFDFSYTEAKQYGFANGTHHRAISQLIGHGFIDPVCKGGKRSFGLSSSLFKLSRRWEEYTQPDFVKINWREIMPDFKKRSSTSKMETYNINNGAENAEKYVTAFQK